jgi:pimeloyl-ACP methyl ester carboxylesterase
MPRRRIIFRIFRLLKMLLPIVLVVVVATIGCSIWLANWIARPPTRPFLVTPDAYAHLSDRGVKVTDETWPNKDGSQARGWLLRGAAGAPAVVLLHKYGADRSWLLNLGVKLNETTNFTVLWPDMRGHGENAALKWTTFGTQETTDTTAALDYLATIKTAQGQKIVGDQIGIYGVELGGYAALMTAAQDTGVRSLVLDSIPSTPDQLVNTVVKERSGFDNGLVYHLARGGMRLYFWKQYDNRSVCVVANTLSDRRVLLIAGGGSGNLHDSTIALARCFPDPAKVEVNTELLVTGFNLPSATSQQSEAYDRKIIEFFDTTLRVKP